jgi:murein DD-endopeptidase MepM/ murein hydrolase activator NlpD
MIPSRAGVISFILGLSLLSPFVLVIHPEPAGADQSPSGAQPVTTAILPIEQPEPAASQSLRTRLKFEQLNLQLCGIVKLGGETHCYIRQAGADRPMAYRPGDVIGGYQIVEASHHSVALERHGTRHWLVLGESRPEQRLAAVSPAEAPPRVVAEANLDGAPLSAQAAGNVEHKTPRLRLKTRRSNFSGAQLVLNSPLSGALHSSSESRFILPMAGRLTSRYGYRRHPAGGGTTFHHGVDIAAPYGTTIRAAASGTVTHVGRRLLLGRYVIISHADGYETVYGHLSRQLVKSGQHVAQGKPIGREGSTGRSTGPHLHFEIRKGGSSIDPESFITIRP